MPTWTARCGTAISLFNAQVGTRGDGVIFSASLDVMESKDLCVAWGEAQGSGLAEHKG